MAAAWMAHCGVKARIVDKRNSKIFCGQADGLQCRSLEIFDSLGFGDRAWKEANHMIEVNLSSCERGGKVKLLTGHDRFACGCVTSPSNCSTKSILTVPYRIQTRTALSEDPIVFPTPSLASAAFSRLSSNRAVSSASSSRTLRSTPRTPSRSSAPFCQNH